MQTVDNVAELRQIIRQWRQAGQSIGFVPTMGNLHAGHIHLVETAKTQADRVVASIFVNPTQFGPNEDFDSYPRTETQDTEKLAACGADLLFLPGVAEIYPRASQTRVSVAGLSALHCGASRPGHFDGVALVVCKLLNMVQPDWLLMGEKDFQQLALIRQMVADLNIPVTVQGVATVREADGLAMSSRNGYLTELQRQTAPALYRALIEARDALLAGAADYRAVEDGGKQALRAAGFNVDYFSVCRIADLQPAGPGDTELVVLAAAKLGSTRLIDNVYFCMPSA
ncbi:pantoate--beta-alanine ligase [Methylomonas sp. EFPC3]|uniref:pantoate--beta-alanine ligase n=1 Tax=Methylomonas sp. EFPC3 TaxID=3021710 RepID=UPI002417D062|nr:pantoate--beta-alanine ligase [Methylomonas sp. EFPC3]WFP49639.1 pantoate--beta-alanine ligase [Methylomonas sp. EFPC3]